MNAFKPAGWPTVIPRIFTDDVDGLVGFARAVFAATVARNGGAPAEVRIGDSMLMVSDGGGVRDPLAAFLYVYVKDADATYARALEAHAVSLEAPTNTPYGDRRATVQDRWGNLWQIATRLMIEVDVRA
ncbi:MAG: VOC family protein [Caulobacteraceae bacterium]